MPEPLYRRIADSLEHQIESGDVAPGAKLPTEHELMTQYGASRNTVRDAVRWLTTRGLVETWPGQGTFVVEKHEPYVSTLSADPETGLGGSEGEAYMTEVRLQGRVPFASDPRVEIEQATGVVAEELQLPAGIAVVSRRVERFIDGAPFSLQTSYYPMDLVNAGATGLIAATSIAISNYLRDTLGLQQARYREVITVRAPAAEETAFFKLPGHGRVAVLETFRTAFDVPGKPFRLTVSVFAADRNQFAIFAGQVPAPARQIISLGPARVHGEGGSDD